jgi:hypothetical protein
MPQPRRKVTRVIVQTEQVDNTLPLAQIVRRVHRGAATELRKARADKTVPDEHVERLRELHRTAAEFAAALEALEETGASD